MRYVLILFKNVLTCKISGELNRINDKGLLFYVQATFSFDLFRKFHFGVVFDIQGGPFETLKHSNKESRLQIHPSITDVFSNSQRSS